jgi:integrase
MLYALLAGSGLRIGEAFALRVEHVCDTVVHVKSSAWEGKLCSPKTANGTREVDLHSSLANALRDHIGSRSTGLVFPSARGTPLRKSNLLRRSLHPILLEMGKQPCGFHAFRRFRVAHLRKQLVPEILLRVWIGHSTEGITDKYALEGVKRDTLFRTITAQKAGLGFTLPELRPIAPTVSSAKCLKDWSGREDLNLRPPGPEPGALPG